ncbi:hypothetical protein M0R89_16450 [Halorussus limi]|uniref:DUF7282 domain-containing protein n=1 Tax=Halorussus limi TaxID=2938695 RepID=A0A8U0HTA5_9EURY|nr:hypothetical protein [Halorussus limi]UPV74117.1 hypothetical protein M0R89_16450 [Halorussus limi]
MLAMGTSAALALGAGPQATADAPAAQETTTTAEETTVAAQQTTMAAEQANVTFTNQTSNGTAVMVERLVVPEGGFVVIHEAESAAAGAEGTATKTTAALATTMVGTTTAAEQMDQQYTAGAVIGNSTYLEPGVHQNVTVQLDEQIQGDQVLIAMLHQDTNDNQQYDFPGADDPYTVDGQPVTDWANVSVQAGATTTAAGVQTTTAEQVETTTEEA